MNEVLSVRPTAHLVMTLIIAGRRPIVETIDLFSGPDDPTIKSTHMVRQYVVATGYGLDYRAGVKNLQVQVESDPLAFAWMRSVLTPRARESVRRARSVRRSGAFCNHHESS